MAHRQRIPAYRHDHELFGETSILPATLFAWRIPIDGDIASVLEKKRRL